MDGEVGIFLSFPLTLQLACLSQFRKFETRHEFQRIAESSRRMSPTVAMLCEATLQIVG